MAEWWQFGLIFVISLTASLIGTYISTPTPRKILEKFYTTTRPFGFWKPFTDLLPEEQRKDTRKEHIRDLIALPFGLLWLVTLLLLPMLLMIRAWQEAAVTASLLTVSLIGLYQFWYKHLPEPAEKDKDK